ncbi:MAG: hypothetical protein M0C28_37880 [Candidatus Moduliflexus flocculans]|nr:hypothetical protein [Candidatus Moduliflexus flocculans]
MKKLTVLALGLLILVPALAFSDSISLRLGYYMPRALSNSYLTAHPDSLWTIELDQMSFPMKDFRGGMLGFSYEYFATKNFSLALTAGQLQPDAAGLLQRLGRLLPRRGRLRLPLRGLRRGRHPALLQRLQHALQLSVKFRPLGRKARIIPFVGGGASLDFWQRPDVRRDGQLLRSLDLHRSRSARRRRHLSRRVGQRPRVRDGLRLARLRRVPDPRRLPVELRDRGPLARRQGPVRGMVRRLRGLRARRPRPDRRLQLLVLEARFERPSRGDRHPGTCPLCLSSRGAAAWVLSKRTTRRPQADMISIAAGEPAGEFVLGEPGPDVLAGLEEIEDERQGEGLLPVRGRFLSPSIGPLRTSTPLK